MYIWTAQEHFTVVMYVSSSAVRKYMLLGAIAEDKIFTGKVNLILQHLLLYTQLHYLQNKSMARETLEVFL